MEPRLRRATAVAGALRVCVQVSSWRGAVGWFGVGDGRALESEREKLKDRDSKWV